MPRYYKRKTNRGSTPRDVLQRAFEVTGKLRQTAKEYDIDPNTLKRYILKVKKNPGEIVEKGYKNLAKIKSIFSTDMENDLAAHIRDLADRFHGLSIDKCRQLALQFAQKNEINSPANWANDEKAGKDWFMTFHKRHNLVNRAPEATSLARATAFNRHSISTFYDNLDKYMFESQDIYNLDETGCTTIQNPGKIVTSRGKIQVGSVTSAERGDLVTIEYAVSAAGNIIPPMFVFPRVNFCDHFLNGGAARSGWMNAEIFVKYMKHFIHHSRCSKERPVLLILDNHDSHISLETIDLARENGVVMVTLPPHTSHRLQPLDRAVYGPFKTAYNLAVDGWVRSHPGETVTIYHIPAIVSQAQVNSLTHRNLLSGFSSIGIYPFNRTLFTDTDFVASAVTDRPNPESLEGDVENTTTLNNEVIDTDPIPGNIQDFEPLPSTSNSDTNVREDQSVEKQPEYVSQPDIAPIPKAPQRKTKGGQKKGSTKILTSTPIRNEIAEAKSTKRIG